MDTKFPFFIFPICKIYLGTWARRVRRACRAREYLRHVETIGMPFSRLPKKGFHKKFLSKTFTENGIIITLKSLRKQPLQLKNAFYCYAFSCTLIMPCSSNPNDPSSIYLLKVSNRNTRTRCEVC